MKKKKMITELIFTYKESGEVFETFDCSALSLCQRLRCKELFNPDKVVFKAEIKSRVDEGV